MDNRLRHAQSSSTYTATALIIWIAGFTGAFILTTILTVFNYLLSNLIRTLSLQGRDIAYLGMLFTIFLVGSVVGCVVLARRFGPLKIMTLGGILAAAGCLICGWVVGTDPSRMSFGVVLFAAGIASVLTGLLTWLIRAAKPLSMTGLGFAAFLLADRLAAPGGAGILFGLANTQSLNVLYSLCGVITLMGTALISGIYWLAGRKPLPPSRETASPQRKPWWLWYLLLILVIASSSAFSNNLMESFFLRGRVNWETLQVIFATPIPALAYLLAILAAGLGSDLAEWLARRSGWAVSGRLVWLLVVMTASGYLLFSLAATQDLGVIISGLRWYSPLDAAVLTALLGLLFSAAPYRQVDLAAGFYIALPPLAVAVFGFLESLVIPPTDYFTPMVFSRIYYLAGIGFSLAMLVLDLRNRGKTAPSPVEPPTGPR